MFTTPLKAMTTRTDRLVRTILQAVKFKTLPPTKVPPNR